MFHRAPGSIGSSAYPSRVFPGMRVTGRMGGERITVKNLQIVKIDAEQNLIYLRGAVPGPQDRVPGDPAGEAGLTHHENYGQEFRQPAGARDRAARGDLRVPVQAAPDPRGRPGLPRGPARAAPTRRRPAPRSRARAGSSGGRRAPAAPVEGHPEPQVAQGRHGARPGPPQLREGPLAPREEERAQVRAVPEARRAVDRRPRRSRGRQPQDQGPAGAPGQARDRRQGAPGRQPATTKICRRASRNVKALKAVDPLAVNVYDVVDRSFLVVSEDALARLVEVLAK